ncbi:MAG: hypothetical protein AAF568_05995, partial [Pseudomonadota bacterium]
TLLVDMPWPEPEQALLSDETVVLPVQVNGKKRAEIEVAKGASPAEIEALAVSEEAVARFIGETGPKKVIVVPGRIVNVVV